MYNNLIYDILVRLHHPIQLIGDLVFVFYRQNMVEFPAVKYNQLVTESAEDVTPDAQGRILLNKNLIAHAGLEKPCLIIGAGRRAEIWNPAVYEAEMADMTDEKLEEEFIKYGF